MHSRIRQWITLVALALIVGTFGSAVPVRAEVDHKIDINTASASELATLPGIGDSKAKAIVEYRAADPFQTIDDLKKVKGIGDKTFESLRPNLMVSEANTKK